MDGERCEVHFSGRVQGVGFRHTTKCLATRFAVTGVVRNLADGRVELVVEGTKREVAAFLQELQREMHGYIDDSTTVRACYQGAFDSFDIAY